MKKLLRSFVFTGLFTLLVFTLPAAAQSRLDLFAGPPDVLYAQSSFLAKLDDPWPPQNSLTHSPYSNPFVPDLNRLAAVSVDKPADSPFTSSSNLILRQELKPPSVTTFQWKTASKEALLYTGVMHAFRFPSEAGTRDALDGPFLRDYANSVIALRGWDDGDSFVTSYIAHPMEGAIFGYIEQQNDPFYRNVEFGEGRRYWMSRLRALAFASVWSTQWTIGPISEASLGNVQLHDSPGFVDLVGSPTFGVFWMMGEDILDKYAISRLEYHTANRTFIILARSFANPCRTFANLMAFKKPWERPNRPGIFRDAFAERSAYVSARRDGSLPDGYDYVEHWRAANHIDTGIDWQPHTGPFPLVSDFELIAGVPHYESFLGGGSCIGGGGSGAVHMGPQFSLVAEVSGCLIINMPHNQSGDSLFYAVGPRWTPHADRRTSPYLQLLVGGRRITHDIKFPLIEARLIKEWDDGHGTLPHFPMRDAYMIEHQQNGFAIAAGGGFDYRLNRGLAWRVASLEYTHTWVPDVDMIHPQEGVRFTSGLILRVGTW